MDERRDKQPASEPGAQPAPLPVPTKLSPVQEAQHARAAHARHCRQCADIDRPLCATGEQLWRNWTTALDAAYDKLHGEI